MSTEENKDIYRRYQAAILEGDPDRLDTIMAPSFVGHDLPPGLPPGPESLKQYRRLAEAAFPDLEFTIEDVIAEGDRVVGRLTLRATHQGTFMGVPATGRQVRTELIEIVRIEDGRVAERWVMRDRLGEMQQLGLVLAAAAAPVAN